MAHPLLTRRFLPLFATQLLSALADNAVKNGLVFLILATVAGERSASLVTLAGALFMAPFFLLSALGGELADGCDKAMVMRRLKGAELVAALAACAGFLAGSVPLLFLALAGFGTVSALFGPAKYAILPDHLEAGAVPMANAAIEGSTFLAILGGAALGMLTSGSHAGGPAILAGVVAAASAACLGTSFLIPPAPAARPGRADPNVLRSTWRTLADLWRHGDLWRLGVGTSVFWLVGAVMMSLLPTLVMRTLGGADVVVSLHFAAFAVALGIGSFVAAWLGGGRTVLLPAVVGAFAAALGIADAGLALHGVAASNVEHLGPAAYLARPGALRVALDLCAIAFCGGLIVVPTFAAVQTRAAPDARAKAVAGVGIMNAAVMVSGGLAVAGLQRLGADGATVLWILAGTVAAAGAWMAAFLPTSLFRDAVAILLRVVYRIEVRGSENLSPEVAGPNPVIAINHVSFLDAAIAMSILPSEPTFAIDAGMARRWWLRPFVARLRAIPLEPASPLGTRTLINAVREGSPLVIFPEGRLTVTDSLMKVYDGAALVADKAGVPVVPVRLAGAEATAFSRLDSRQARKRWFPRIVVTVLPPERTDVDPALKGRARRQAAGAALYGIMSDAAFRTSETGTTVLEAVIAAAKVHGTSRTAVEDPIAGAMSYRRLLTAARALAVEVAKLPATPLEGGLGSAVGVMLPSSCAAAATILAVQSAGRTPAMINFTAGKAAVVSACRAARVSSVITSRAFVAKAKLEGLVRAVEDDPEAGVRFVDVEDLRRRIGALDKVKARFGRNRPLVVPPIAPGGERADMPAAILFTSGSEGAPKGVVLTHRSVLANSAQAAARIDFGRTDKVFSVLPTFHSFGLTAGLILPLTYGVPVYLYPSPLHYRMIPELLYGSNATVLFGTDTFLTGYARSANAYDFRSLRYVVAGAEPVKASTRMTWLERFGLRILEGYGVTETGPVLAINSPMHNRFGTVGRLMPGMEHRLEAVPGVAEGGRLVVRGPNVMAGYLKDDRPGVLQPPEGGWYDTGDVVAIDAQGFIAIKGRAKRFAKVAGEMVSLAAVEAVAAELWPDAASACAAVPDERKGQRIVLATTAKGATRGAYAAAAKAKGLAEVGYPAEVLVVDALPLLGSGKVDFKGVADLVEARASAPVPEAGAERELEEAAS